MTTKNPWLGLASYEEPKNDGNDYLFCGRDEETLDVVRLIDNNLFITLYGSSGIGKTSLLRAGVIPILRRKDYFPLYVRLSQEPAEISYAEAIVHKLQKSGLKEESGAAMKHSDGNDRLYLWNFFATTRFLKEGREVYPVIILDQFEEVFREGDKAKAELLLKQIYLLLNDELEMPDEAGYSADTNYRFVASIREDFLFVLEDSIDENSLDLYKNNRYRLRPMKPEQAMEVVLVPGRDCIETESKVIVANQIVSLAEHNSKNSIDTLLLSLICSELFNVANQKQSNITKGLIEQLGDNILSSFYERAMRSVSTITSDYLESHLLTQNGFRNSLALEDVLHEGIIKEDLDMLIEKHLIRIEHSNKGNRIEFIHDAICIVAKKSRDKHFERDTKKTKATNSIGFLIDTVIASVLIICTIGVYFDFLYERGLLSFSPMIRMYISILITTFNTFFLVPYRYTNEWNTSGFSFIAIFLTIIAYIPLLSFLRSISYDIDGFNAVCMLYLSYLIIIFVNSLNFRKKRSFIEATKFVFKMESYKLLNPIIKVVSIIIMFFVFGDLTLKTLATIIPYLSK